MSKIVVLINALKIDHFIFILVIMFSTSVSMANDEKLALMEMETHKSSTNVQVRERGISSVNQTAVKKSVIPPKLTESVNHAILIGINDYDYFPKLRTAINDVNKLGDLLSNQYGFSVKIIENATRKEIINSIADYRRSVGVNDRLIIYYAGHGILDKRADEGFWLPVDAQKTDFSNMISNSTITSLVRSMPAKHVLLMVDSCFSGKLTRGVSISFESNEYDRMDNARSRTVLTSGGLEPVEDGSGQHSIFAKSLLRILENNPSKMFSSALFQRLRRAVVLNSDQTPEYADLMRAGHEGGEFIFSNISYVNVVATESTMKGRSHATRETHSFSKTENSKISPVNYVDLIFDGANDQRFAFSDDLAIGIQGPEMIVLPKGQFTMGDLAGRGSETETPMHRVDLNYRFALSRHEVTFDEYDAFARATNSELPNSADWGRGDKPVINVSWDDAVKYTKWLSKQTGKRYRLPSEAEWEYAARAGSDSMFHWGNHTGDNLSNCLNCDELKPNEKGPVKVGSYSGNAFGLYDMHGNVSEWTGDCWNPAYNGAPYDGKMWLSGDCSRRVIRGGDWSQNVNRIRAAARSNADASKRDQNQGFRVAISLSD